MNVVEEYEDEDVLSGAKAPPEVTPDALDSDRTARLHFSGNLSNYTTTSVHKMVGWNRLNLKKVNSFRRSPSEVDSVCSKMENLENMNFQSDVSESQDTLDVIFKLKSMEKLIFM